MNGYEACEHICEVYKYFNNFDDEDNLSEQNKNEDEIKKLFDKNFYDLKQESNSNKYSSFKFQRSTLKEEGSEKASPDMEKILR